MAQDLFQVLDGLEVSDEDIREAEIFAVNFLQPLYPDLDLREGTAIRDTSVRPSATLLALLRKGVEYYFTINSLSNATDQTPEDTIDKILSNFFLTRNQGGNSKVEARLYFAQAKNVTISNSLYFSTDNERFFFPTETVSSVASDLIFDTGRQQYYVDIELESEAAGEEYNIESGELLFFSTFDPFFVGGDILFLKERSIDDESNTSFIERAGSAISTRNLINTPSIESRIQETFNFFSNILSVGMGEPEMLRDLITVRAGIPATNTLVHVGGHVDVYVDSEIEIIEEQFPLQSLPGGRFGFIIGGQLDPNFAAVYDIVRVEGVGDAGPDTLPLDTATPVTGFDGTPTTIRTVPVLQNYTSGGDPVEPQFDLGLSSRQEVIVELQKDTGAINPHFQGATASFQMKRVSGLASLQSFLDDSLSRVLCADLLARSYEVFNLDINIVTYNATEVTVQTVDSFVRQYLSTLRPGEPFSVSDMINVLIEDAGLERIELPSIVNYSLAQKNLTTLTGSFDSILYINRLQRFRINSVTLNGETL